MKLSITFKDPDVVHDAAYDCVKASIPEGLSQDEIDMIGEMRTAEIKQKLSKWITYGEYVTIEFDLDAGTATVKERK